jgi:hypothetical protein
VLLKEDKELSLKDFQTYIDGDGVSPSIKSKAAPAVRSEYAKTISDNIHKGAAFSENVNK